MGSTNLVGRAVDRYDVGEQLGQGGFGAVYRATHRVLGTPVALKVLWPDRADDPASVERFLQEARAAAAIGSPHIVAVSDAGLTDDGIVYLAMELLEGRDLADELKRRRALPTEEASQIVCEILEGLGAAHEAGVIHRDLKPGNIFMAEGPDGRQVKLLDFGISKVLGAKALTAEGMMLGTPHYMAPEQLEGSPSLDHRADIFAVGCILYELITSEVPIPGDSYQVLVQRVQGMRPPDIRTKAPRVSSTLADVVMRALAIDPDARWPSARVMQAALQEVLASGGASQSAPSLSTVMLDSTAPPSSPGRSSYTAAPSSAPAEGRPNPLFVAGLGGLAVLLVGALGVFGVLSFRLYTRPAPASPTPTATNPVPVIVDPAVPRAVAPVVVAPPVAGRAPSSAPAPRLRLARFAGTGPRAEIDALLLRAVSGLQNCARSRRLNLVLTMSVSGPNVGLVLPHPTRRSDDRDAAQCAASAIREAGPVDFGATEAATMDIEIELPAR